jgi:hypothetical protein
MIRPEEITGIIGCEESQAEANEFRALGFNVFSCDLKPCSGGHPEYHIQGDVFEAIKFLKPDFGIFHPPCTHLASSGAQWFPGKIADGRQKEAIEFFKRFTKLSFPWVIENPQGIMSSEYRKPDQIIQPYYFGDEAQKTTHLWLNIIPRLYHNAAPNLFDQVVTHVGKGKFHVTKSGKKLPEWYNLPPADNRGEIRSKTFPGIAKAMAQQWGKYLLNMYDKT